MSGIYEMVKASVKHRNSGELDQVRRVIDRVLKEAIPRIPGEYRNAVTRSIEEASTGEPPLSEVSKNLAFLTRDLDFRSTSTESWLVLRWVLMMHGFLHAGGVARGHARKAALERVARHKRTTGLESTLRAIQASFDLGDIELAGHFLGLMRGDPRLEECLVSFDSYLRMCEGRYPDGRVRAAAPQSFCKLVAKQSVAVVGPAPSEHEQGAEIDGFDVVVRVNYWGTAGMAPESSAGKRTDISYYSVSQGSKAVEDKSGLLGDLQFSVFKADPLPRAFPSRVAQPVRPVCFAGIPNMIPIMVFDLLHFRPSRIKVFGTNFFMSEMSHYRSYRGTSGTSGTTTKSPSRRLPSFATHDLCDQTHIMRNLMNAGFVDMDGQGRRVLEMPDEEYLITMESIYNRFPSCNE